MDENKLRGIVRAEVSCLHYLADEQRYMRSRIDRLTGIMSQSQTEAAAREGKIYSDLEHLKKSVGSLTDRLNAQEEALIKVSGVTGPIGRVSRSVKTVALAALASVIAALAASYWKF